MFPFLLDLMLTTYAELTHHGLRMEGFALLESSIKWQHSFPSYILNISDFLSNKAMECQNIFQNKGKEIQLINNNWLHIIRGLQCFAASFTKQKLQCYGYIYMHLALGGESNHDEL